MLNIPAMFVTNCSSTRHSAEVTSMITFQMMEKQSPTCWTVLAEHAVSAEGSVFECLTQQSIDRMYTKEKDPYIEEHWKQYHDPYLLLLQFNSPIMNVNMKGVTTLNILWE